MRAAQRSTVLTTVVGLLLLAASVWAAVTGIVSGTVVDAKTGEPLSGANITVAGTNLAAVSDRDGKFTIVDVPAGPHAVTVSLVGYAELSITDVTVTQGIESQLRAELQPAVVPAAGAEATVTAPAPKVAPRRDVTASEYTVTAADEQVTLSQPNDRYQFPGLVFAQPGVTPDSTFYPHIRGGRDNTVGYFLDGIPITEPNANVFATNIVSIGLDRLELFTGGYPAEYGGYTGGIINEVVKRGDEMRDGKVDLAMGSPYDFGGLIFERGDVDGKADWYYGLNTWHTEFPGNLFTSEAPTVSDHIGKLIYDLDDRDKLTLLSHHGYARYLFPFERQYTFLPELGEWEPVEPDSDYGRQGYDVDSIGFNRRNAAATSFWNLRFSRVANYLQLELGDPYNAYWQHRNARMFIGQFDYQHQVGAHRVSAGLWNIDSDNNSRYSVFGTQSTPFGLLDSISNNDTRNTQAYAEDKWQLSRRLLLSLGGRLDRMTYRRDVGGDTTLDEVTPRLGGTYSVSPRFLLRGSAGTYVGFPRASLIASEFVPHASEDPTAPPGLTWDQVFFPSFPLRPEVDREHELGFDWKVGPATLLTATVFQRDSDQLTQRWQGVRHDAQGNIVLDANGNPIPSFNPSDFDPNAPVWFAGTGRGIARGLELKVDRKLSDHTRAWLSYTYLKAQATSPEDNAYPIGYGFLNRTDPASLNAEFPVEWDQRHTMALAVHHEIGKLTLDPWLTYGSGFPYGQSGLDVGGSDPAHVPNPNYDANDPNSPAELTIPQNYVDPTDPAKGFATPGSLKTSANFTFNLNLGYRLHPRTQLYIQVFNVFNRSDVTSYVFYHPNTGGLIGKITDGNISYVPFSRTPPRFFAFGIKQEF